MTTDRPNHRVTGPRVRTRQGNTLIEAAFVFNILLLLSFCTVEFGYYLYAKHTIQGAAREGARAAVVPGATTAEVTQAVARTLFAAGMNGGSLTVDSSRFTVTLSPTDPNQPAGTAMRVDVTSNMNLIGPRPAFFIPNKAITGSTVMRKEG
jgi:Flp pilus assembly protein TadG